MRRFNAALVAVMLAGCRNEPAIADAAKPTVHVLTSLPLLFDEGFGLSPADGGAAKYLRDQYALKPIDLPSQLPDGATLLAAQPRALPAEELVALDAWVRRGGRLVLLADPMLEWPSERELGDRLRPPVSFADTGLLLHWGLRLDAPDARGLKVLQYDRFELAYVSPGKLTKVGGECVVEPDGVLAWCRMGKGEARIVADADLLNEKSIERQLGRGVDNIGPLSILLDAFSGKVRG